MSEFIAFRTPTVKETEQQFMSELVQSFHQFTPRDPGDEDDHEKNMRSYSIQLMFQWSNRAFRRSQPHHPSVQ